MQPYRRMQVWDAAGGDALAFDADALGQPQLGWIIENNALVDALWRLLPTAGVRLHCPASIEALMLNVLVPVSVRFSMLGARLYVTLAWMRSIPSLVFSMTTSPMLSTT